MSSTRVNIPLPLHDVALPRSDERQRATVETLEAVAAVYRWCRSSDLPPLAEREVPGTTDRERSQLAALGRIAAALANRAGTSLGDRELPASVQWWLQGTPSPPQDLTERLEDALKDEADVFALIYERIVASRQRRKLGTFFTPSWVLAYIRTALDAHLTVAPAVVADPGAGVGAFTAAALEWWPGAEVYAVDVNLVTLGLLAMRPDLRNARERRSDAIKRLHVQQQDFLEWLGESWPKLMRPGLIFGNPPYTRHQLLSSEVKRAARSATRSLTPGGAAGLSTYFLAASLQALGPVDTLCLLLPANWLEADYARPVRRHLWQLTRRRVEIHLFPNDFVVFPGAQVGAMIIIVGHERSPKQPLVVRQVGVGGEGRLVAEQVELDRNGSVPSTFTLDALRRHGISTPRRTEESVPLGLLAHIRRGVATGANWFFLRTDEEVVGLPTGTYVPAITRLRGLPEDLLFEDVHAALGAIGARRWLLYLNKEDIKHDTIRHLIEQGEHAGAHQGYLCMKRRVWYCVERMTVPDLIFGPMGKEKFPVTLNLAKAVPTNTLYGIRLLQRSVNPGALERMAGWLVSAEGQAAISAVARKHGDGLLKLEPRALSTVPVPSHIAAAFL